MVEFMLVSVLAMLRNDQYHFAKFTMMLAIQNVFMTTSSDNL